MGEVPDWYPVIRAAKALNSQAWVLAGVPDTAACYLWTVWGLSCEGAEASAQKQLSERQAKASTVRSRPRA